MEKQVINSENQRGKTKFSAQTRGRRIVYLRNKTASANPLYCRIECPGFCACASK